MIIFFNIFPRSFLFLGSSFAFIAPIIKATELYGLSGTLFGIIGVGLVYGIMSLILRLRGIGFVTRLFPPIVVGPVIMLIGLSLAGTGVDMAKTNWLIAIIALLTTVVVSLFGKGILRLIPIFAGIIVGYIVSQYLMPILMISGRKNSCRHSSKT